MGGRRRPGEGFPLSGLRGWFRTSVSAAFVDATFLSLPAIAHIKRFRPIYILGLWVGGFWIPKTRGKRQFTSLVFRLLDLSLPSLDLECPTVRS